MKGPTSIALKSSLSKSGCALASTRQERFYHRNILPSKPQSRRQRRINVDRVSFDGRTVETVPLGWHRVRQVMHTMAREGRFNPLDQYSIRKQVRTAFKANSSGRCFRYLDCLMGGSGPSRIGFRSRTGGDEATKSSSEPIRRATPQAVSLSSRDDRNSLSERSSLLKRLCSQNVLFVVNRVRSAIAHRALDSRPVPTTTNKAFWQKSRRVLVKTKSRLCRPLTTERVARKRITKPPELELVEYVDSFKKRPDSGCARSARKFTAGRFTKTISLESCFSPMRSREVFIGHNHPIKG